MTVQAVFCFWDNNAIQQIIQSGILWHNGYDYLAGGKSGEAVVAGKLQRVKPDRTSPGSLLQHQEEKALKPQSCVI